jgi:hypothetical protein
LDYFKDKRNAVIPRIGFSIPTIKSVATVAQALTWGEHNGLPLSGNPNRDTMMSKDPEDVRWLTHLSGRICGDLIAVEAVLIIGRRHFYRHAIPKSPWKG